MFQRDATSKIAIFRDGYVSDCYNDKNVPDQTLVFDHKIIDSKKLRATDNKLEDYEKSSCVTSTAYSYDNLYKIDDYVIKHVQGTNDLAYQLSYEQVIEELKSVKNKNEFDKKLLKSMEYLISNKNEQQLIPQSFEEFQVDGQLTGPDQDASSGSYKMHLKVNFVQQKVYKLTKDKQKKLESTNYLIDSIETEYLRVGE